MAKATIKYNGKAFDTEHVPLEFEKDDNGQDDKKKPPKSFRLDKIPTKTFKLWGHEFPEGEEVEVSDPKLIKKAKGLKCLEVFEEPVKIVEGSPPATETADEPKRGPGRPRKVTTD